MFAWCHATGVSVLPAAPEAVADFISAKRRAGKRPATIRHYGSSIAHLHRAVGLPVPSDSNTVKLALRRMMEGDGAAQQQADGLTRRLVNRALHAGCGRLRHLRNRALLAVADDTRCHRSELVARWRVRHPGQPIFWEQKYSVPSSATSTRAPSRWKGARPPRWRSSSRTWSKTGCRCAGCTGSSIARMWLSVGTAAMPNKVRQFDVARPSSRLRWWARNDSDCMKNSENADIPMSAML